MHQPTAKAFPEKVKCVRTTRAKSRRVMKMVMFQMMMRLVVIRTKHQRNYNTAHQEKYKLVHFISDFDYKYVNKSPSAHFSS